MTRWIEKIELNAVLSQVQDEFDLSIVEEDCPAEVKERLATEIEKSFHLRHLAHRIREAKAIAAVNRALNDIYDEADAMKVWCGL